MAPRRPAAADAGHRARSRDGAAAPGGLRLHGRGRPHPHQPHGGDGTEADRLDGQRHAAGGALREAAAALQLLQAALRPGDEPARRRHPRGDHHGGGDRHRAGGEPARAGARVRAPALAAHPGAAQRGAGEVPQPRRQAGLARLQRPSRCPCCSRWRTAGPGCARRSRTCAGRPREAIAEGRNIIILSDRGHDEDRRAHPGAAGGRGGAAPPAARGHAHPGRHRARDRRAARGAPLRAAHRLRRRAR